MGNNNNKRKLSSSGGKRADSSRRTDDVKNNSAQPKKKRGAAKLTKSKKAIMIVSILLAVIAVLALSLYIAYRVLVVPPDINPPDVNRPDRVTVGPNGEDDDPDDAIDYGNRKPGVYTVLVAGHNYGLTDVMIVVSFDTVNKEINMLSIPRDTFSNVTNRTVKRINGAFNTSGGLNDKEKGMDAVLDEVQMLIGFRPDNYILLNYDGFVELVEVLQGVEFDVPKPTNPYYKRKNLYHVNDDGKVDIDLAPGLQTLNGQQALGLVRFRAGYIDADLGRIKTVQNFLMACAKKAVSTLSYTKITQYAEIFDEYVYTDLSIFNIAWFMQQAWGIDLEENLHGYTPNNYTTPQSSYVYLYPVDMVNLVNQTINPYLEDVTLDDVNIYNPHGNTSGKLTYSETGNTESKPLDPDATPEGTTSNKPANGGTAKSNNTQGSNQSGNSLSGNGSSSTKATPKPKASPSPKSSPKPKASPSPKPSPSTSTTTDGDAADTINLTDDDTGVAVPDNQPSQEPDLSVGDEQSAPDDDRDFLPEQSDKPFIPAAIEP